MDRQRKNKVKARRTGFQLISALSGTSHYIQGKSLEAVFADIVRSYYWEEPDLKTIIGSYVMLSRTKFTDKLWILRPFQHCLFTRGPPPGPDILLKKLTQEISTGMAQERWAKVEEERRGRSGNKKKEPQECLEW